MRRALVLSWLCCSYALNAKWTPAADGGPARFSKRYRDAQGIDDSRWTNDHPSRSGGSWLPSVLPETLAGWLFAACAMALIYFLYQQQQPRAHYAQGGSGTARPSSDAGEAARAAFLKKYG